MQAPCKTPDEFARIYERAAQGHRSHCYTLMLFLSERLGLRPCELATLDSSWFRAGELRIPAGYSKRGRARTLPYNDEVALLLEQHMQGRKGPVFLVERGSKAGKPFSAKGISDAMARLYREAGEVGSCYSGRRTFASTLNDRGVSLRVIQDVLGHSNLATTARYIEVTPRARHAAVWG